MGDDALNGKFALIHKDDLSSISDHYPGFHPPVYGTDFCIVAASSHPDVTSVIAAREIPKEIDDFFKDSRAKIEAEIAADEAGKTAVKALTEEASNDQKDTAYSTARDASYPVQYAAKLAAMVVDYGDLCPRCSREFVAFQNEGAHDV